MTNLKYVEEVMNSNMSADAMAMALSVLVGREPSQRIGTIITAQNQSKWSPYRDGNGTEYSKNILNSRLLAIALPMLEATETGIRAKDIAEVYNDAFDPYSKMDYNDTKNILLKLLDCGIVKYENVEEKVEIIDRRGLKREILTSHRVYFLNI